MERRNPDQDAPERRPWPMFKLQRNHAPVCPKESTELSHLGKVERTSTRSNRTLRDQQVASGHEPVRSQRCEL